MGPLKINNEKLRESAEPIVIQLISLKEPCIMMMTEPALCFTRLGHLKRFKKKHYIRCSKGTI